VIIALREGSAAAVELAALLGDEFTGAALDDAQLAGAAEKLAMMDLLKLCCERVEGDLLGDDDVPITEIDDAIAALLLRDRSLRACCGM